MAAAGAADARQGHRWNDHRMVVNGILFRTRPGAAMADKAYSSAANRAYLRRRGIQAVIPVKEDQKKNRRARGRSGGRPPAFDPGRYKERNTVERCFSKLKQFRAVATRYDKRDFMYQATVDVASIRIWLRDPVP